jgi:hypothetical protein
MSRVLIVFACSSLLTACAGEQAPVASLASGSGWQTGTAKLVGDANLDGKMQLGGMAPAAANPAKTVSGFYQPPKLTDEERELLAAAKKTQAGKVLGAIALEQVTGRKPDPARLAH